MPKRVRFQPVRLGRETKINPRQEACLIELEDEQGNVIELAMTTDLGALLVSSTRAAFRSLEDRKRIEEGTTAEERRSWASKSAVVAMPFTAEANPHGGEFSPVLVTIAPASTYEQTFGLTVKWAEKLAEELQAAVVQMQKDRDQ